VLSRKLKWMIVGPKGEIGLGEGDGLARKSA
jgi:hypothetical protein